MDIANLRTFLAVARFASFTRAARQLHLTQPAVSKRVTSLEEELGCPLFDRIGHRVSLTQAGEALLPRAKHILEALEDSRRVISNLSGRVEGTLTVGTSHHIGLHRLPPVLRAFNARYPAVDLDIRFLDSEAACRGVEQGELEMAVVTLPPEPPRGLSVTPLWPDPLAVVTGRDHPLAGRPRLQPEELARHPAILPAPGTYTRDRVEAAFRPLAAPLRVSLSTNYLETIKMLVSVGLGWSTLPLTMVDEELVAHEVPNLHLHRTLGLVTHEARTLSGAARAFGELLAANADATPAGGP